MQVIEDIFTAFSGPTGLARATGFPVQTVHEWRVKSAPDIPPWRRPAVLEAARRESKVLPDHCVQYLMSSDRLRQAS